MARYLVRMPDHLGDGVQALPALAALCADHDVVAVGPGWVAALAEGLGCDVARDVAAAGGLETFDAAVLFKPSFSAAWAVRKVRRRIGVAWDGRRLLLTEVVPRDPAAHRSAEYRDAVRLLGIDVTDLPSIETAPTPCPRPTLLMLPGTASPETVRWLHFGTLAQAARAAGWRVQVAAGPGEEDLVSAVAGPDEAVPTLPLDGVAALAAGIIATGGAIVGNDSGLTHLAAAAVRGSGGEVQRVHVVYGSTDPARTGPPGTTAHWGARPDCWPCYAKRCDVGQLCLHAPATAVLAAIGAP